MKTGTETQVLTKIIWIGSHQKAVQAAIKHYYIHKFDNTDTAIVTAKVDKEEDDMECTNVELLLFCCSSLHYDSSKSNSTFYLESIFNGEAVAVGTLVRHAEIGGLEDG